LRKIFSTFILLSSSAWANPDPVDFNYQIRPILSDRCFLCHGFDAKHREADLRLDTPEGAFAKRKDGQAIVPGNPEKSVVWQRIISTDPDFIMPTPESHLTLNDDEKALIKRWIEEGADYQKHWSFIPPERPKLPTVSDTKWIKNPIDQFILAKLDKEDLKPSPRADKTTLSRRLAFDLTGLPPDSTDSTIPSQIDSLLASPHFGERWALPWLDASRYSDSNGFQHDHNRFSWPWRDYMIKALNSNKPQNELVVELLAGDLIENATESQILATAFNRNHPLNGEGGAISSEVIFNYVVDRVDASATTFLGLTFACSQCHDHKYDPISHEDYYRFFAFFGNMKEDAQPKVRIRSSTVPYTVAKPLLKLNIPDAQKKYDDAKLIYDAAKKILDSNEKNIQAAQTEWAHSLPDDELKKLPGQQNKIVRKLRKKEKLAGWEKRSIRRYFINKVTENQEWIDATKQADEENKKLATYEELIPQVMVMKERSTPMVAHMTNLPEKTFTPPFPRPSAPSLKTRTSTDSISQNGWCLEKTHSPHGF